MALTFVDSREDTMSLEGFIELVDRSVDIYDEDAVAECSASFAALARNRTLLSDVLNRELVRWRDFQPGNSYAGQTFMLGAGKRKRFFVRANMWVPRAPAAPISDWERRMFAYGLAHDHNFTLMTAGYLGHGYETDIFEYDPTRLKGMPEEPVSVTFLERTRLAAGKIILFRQSRDIHIQGAPQDVSISLNLMIPARDAHSRQLFFDVEKGIARDVTDVSPDRTEHLVCEMAALAGDDTSLSLLHDLGRVSRNPRVRSACDSAIRSMERASSGVLEKNSSSLSTPL